MRRYSLASAIARNIVDLRDYDGIITNAVKTVMPHAIVEVSKNSYSVHPSPNQGQAVSIGKLICQSVLREYCIGVMIWKLFTSEEVEENENYGKNGEHPDGGHH